VVESSVRNYTFRPVIDKWMVNVTMMQTISVGAGGGSIASVTQGRLAVGPRSAGSMPGPVCYDLGGTEPTVTDADVVLGYINPDTYYGGRMPLNKAKAEKAIRDKVAQPLGLETIEAAALIRRVVDENMAGAIKREVHMRGYHPEDFVLFAFGGAGPTHMNGLRGDVPKAVMFPAAPVFCAMGSSIMDIVHMYEQSRRMIFMEPMSEKLVVDPDAFNAVVEDLIGRARADLASEGLNVEDAQYSLELDMLYGGQVNLKRASSPRLRIDGADDAKAIYDAFEREFRDVVMGEHADLPVRAAAARQHRHRSGRGGGRVDDDRRAARPEVRDREARPGHPRGDRPAAAPQARDIAGRRGRLNNDDKETSTWAFQALSRSWPG
jgi:N-methylhydantoinase A/acetophenone carboxylase